MYSETPQDDSSLVGHVQGRWGPEESSYEHKDVESPKHPVLNYPEIPYNFLQQGLLPPSSPKYYPFPFILILLWIGSIVAMVYNHEMAASYATKVVKKPFQYDVLPGLWSTIFTQAHVPITALYLARLAVSALRSPKLSPQSWTELFWMSDRNWVGPVGMGTTMFYAFKSRLRLSVTFLLFSAICATAVATPTILNRAYVLSSVIVERTIPDFKPNATSHTRMEAVDYESQLGTGEGAWGTGRSVISLFNTSTFTPENGSRSEQDMFFSGDVQGKNVTLPGIRHNGSCEILSDDRSMPSYVQSHANFVDACDKRNWFTMNTELLNVSYYYVDALYQSCGDVDWTYIDGNSSFTGESLAWFSSTNGSYTARGTIYCNSTFSFGTAQIVGETLTFAGFTGNDVYHKSDSTAGNPIVHPLSAALYLLGNGTNIHDPVGSRQWLTRMGYQQIPYYKIEGGPPPEYFHPDLQDFADHLWTGISHMANAVVLMSIDDNDTYVATEHLSATGYVKYDRFVTAVYALLSVWLFLVIVATVIMYRPAFTDSLNSYAIAQIVSEKPELEEGLQTRGGLNTNQALRSRFTNMGD